ncbi:MAG: PEP-CTERM sorting domain-containing protein [Acidobacteriota bacterium]|nr:PEP-CTERM sorting domain-containing protein [Acidobacteriota bacterium]
MFGGVTTLPDDAPADIVTVSVPAFVMSARFHVVHSLHACILLRGSAEAGSYTGRRTGAFGVLFFYDILLACMVHVRADVLRGQMQVKFLTKGAMFSVLAVAAFNGMAQGAIIRVFARAVITETDFISWNSVSSQLGDPFAPPNPGTALTNGGVSFTYSQAQVGSASNTMHFQHFGSLDSGDGTQKDLVGENVDFNFIDLSFDPTKPFQMLGFDFQGNDGFGSSYTVTLAVFGAGHTSLGSLMYVSLTPTPSFIGISSDMANITEIQVSSSGAAPFAIDRVSLNNGAPLSGVPEPGTFGLLVLGGLGIFGISVYARRRSA